MKVKVNQTDITSYGLVVSIVATNLKEIGL